MAPARVKDEELALCGPVRTWKPSDGTQTIRIVPTADGDPFKDYWFHYNLGPENKSGLLCPKKNHGEDCPICNFKDQLWKEFNDTQDADTMKLAKDLSPRQRFFSPVMVRGEEAQGIRVWGYGKMAYESLLELVLNPEYGDITDVDEGQFIENLNLDFMFDDNSEVSFEQICKYPDI